MLKKYATVALLSAFLAYTAFAQQPSAGPAVLDAAAIKAFLPNGFFFDGQVAPTQARNANAIRFVDGKYVIACLVDNSGYSSDVAQKFQGILVAEEAVSVNGSLLPAGVYGFGLTPNKDQFNVLNVGAGIIFTVKVNNDLLTKHPVPLKIETADEGYRLYLGRAYVTIREVHATGSTGGTK